MCEESERERDSKMKESRISFPQSHLKLSELVKGVFTLKLFQ